jgi:hypothetical protein
MAPFNNLPDEVFQFGFQAHGEAQRAAILANHGLRFKQRYYEAEGILRKWSDLLVNAPIALHNCLFLIFFIADIFVSWEMIKDIIAQGGLFIGEVPAWATLLLCLLINAWAAVTAHFIGKGWSREIQSWERWNYVFIKTRNTAPLNILNDELDREIRRARILAILSGGVLLALVGLIVYYRYQVIPYLNQPEDSDLVIESITSNPINLVIYFLPVAILIGEFFTGDYVWYVIRRTQIWFKRTRNRQKFLKNKELCGAADHMAYQYVQGAQNARQPIEIIGDLEKSMLRVKHRTQTSDDYLDPFSGFRRIGFTFRYRHNGQAIVGTSAFGTLPNGAKTGDYHTDLDGKVTMQWDGDFDRLEFVQILGKDYLGPFQANAEHYIDVSDSVFITPNGNGTVHYAEQT